MAPIVHGLEAEYSDRMIFTYLDIDDPATEDFKSQLSYQVQPHFILLDADGNVLQQWVGRVTEGEFMAAFEAGLNQ
jgi:hypothetical protein